MSSSPAYDLQPWNRQSKRFWAGSQSSLGPNLIFWIERSRAVHGQNTLHRDTACKTSTHINASLEDSPSTRIHHTHSKLRCRRKTCTLRACQPAGSLLSPQREGPVLTGHKYKYLIMRNVKQDSRKKSNKNVIFHFSPNNLSKVRCLFKNWSGSAVDAIMLLCHVSEVAWMQEKPHTSVGKRQIKESRKGWSLIKL